MEYNKYIEIIDKTAVYPKTVDNFGKVYSYLGLMGEWSEMSKEYSELIYTFYQNKAERREKRKMLSKEIGDVIWYMTCMCKEMDLNMESYLDIISEQESSPYFDNAEEIMEDIATIQFTDLAETIKKYYRDGKEIDTEKVHYILKVCSEYIGQIISEVELTLDTILTENYNKLIKRRDTNTLHGDGSNREEATS